MERVEYRNVPAWPGYRVGSDGSVWTRRRSREYRPMKLSRDRGGYLTVSLACVGERRRFPVHALVLRCFLGPRPAGLETRHMNGVRSDNRLGNLRYGTRLENQADRVRHGTTLHGERNPKARLTEEQVRLARWMRQSEGMMLKDIASYLGVSKSAVWVAVQGHTWKHVA